MSTTPALRPYLPSDAARCAAIFRASIEALTSDDYGDEQRRAWAATADDVAAFGARLAKSLTLVATISGEPIGFGSLKGADVIDMLYVDPEFARRGVGALLIDALTRLAKGRGAKQLTSEVSDTAKASFENQGFVAQRRNLIQLDDEWLANTTMLKPLVAADPARPPTSKLH
ncbi:GNAT family N-acetyltransferase [Methylocapsa sp. S129]|uniref:GNAT family N-acetyltransferase n=1 Tax=Methylocapsa sp. S129 TaxID=1641869 RepID=UPI003529F726